MLEPVRHVLNSWEKRYTNPAYRQLQTILLHWEEVVGTQVAQQTKPIGIQRNVLRVATCNSTWSQHLMFERTRILQKLNRQLAMHLVDIRFQPGDISSTAPSDRARSATDSVPDAVIQSHPSWVKPTSAPQISPKPNTPQDAFESWSQQVIQRGKALTPCPHCQCPTPPGELERWSMCSFCVTKHWQKIERP